MSKHQPRIAVLDDWQGVAQASADWSGLERRAELVFFDQPFADEDAAADALAGFDVLVAMRERTRFGAGLLTRLPCLRMLAQTGARSMSLDLDACTAGGVVVCNTGVERASLATAELTLGLMLATARRIPQGDVALRAGRFQSGVGCGPVLRGRTLGLIGLGKVGAMVAGYAQALGMRVLAWSPNLTDEAARAQGAMRVERDTLLAESDVVSLHVVLSDRSRGMLGVAELARMKPGAILINTARGPLVDEAALQAALREGRIQAGLDVFEPEPLPPHSAWFGMPNAVLTPHLGYACDEIFAQFYQESVENILAWLDGAPIRVLNPAVLEPPTRT